MWNNLADCNKKEYQDMILALASLSEMFSQKSNTDDKNVIVSPVVNYKYQETVFQKVFDARLQDKSNKPFDASLLIKDTDGHEKLCLVGIKTFTISSKYQKIAQFKSHNKDFIDLFKQITDNSLSCRTKADIDKKNKVLYKELVALIVTIRNESIKSATNSIQGFYERDERYIEPIYHVLVTSAKNTQPKIIVGETNYDVIDEDNISHIGCSTKDNPTNIKFSDGKHNYKFTSADCQLWMEFNIDEIIQKEWKVEYVDDAYAVFKKLITTTKKQIKSTYEESYEFKLDVRSNPYSAFNSFYGTSHKNKESYESKLKKFATIFKERITNYRIKKIKSLLEQYNSDIEVTRKVKIREELLDIANRAKDKELRDYIYKMFRPKYELYIPLYKSRSFHHEHPDFFNSKFGEYVNGFDINEKIVVNENRINKIDRSFTVVLDDCQEELTCFISQDDGKGFESLDKQEKLGKWLLKKVFLLKDYEQLTQSHLDDLQINGMKLTKTCDGKIHLSFIWIEND